MNKLVDWLTSVAWAQFIIDDLILILARLQPKSVSCARPAFSIFNAPTFLKKRLTLQPCNGKAFFLYFQTVVAKLLKKMLYYQCTNFFRKHFPPHFFHQQKIQLAVFSISSFCSNFFFTINRKKWAIKSCPKLHNNALIMKCQLCLLHKWYYFMSKRTLTTIVLANSAINSINSIMVHMFTYFSWLWIDDVATATSVWK